MDVSSVPAVSCLVFFVIVVLLLSIIYHKHSHCCKLRSCRGPRTDMVRPFFFFFQEVKQRQTALCAASSENKRYSIFSKKKTHSETCQAEFAWL